MVSDWLNDEVKSFRGHLLNALLNNMVTVLIINAVKDSVLQLRDQKLLLRQRYNL